MRTIRPSIGPWAPIGLILVLMATVAACAGSSVSQQLAPVGDAVSGGGLDDGGGQPAPSGAPVAPDGGDGGGDGVGAPLDDARIIRTGTIDLEVGDVATALARARDGIRGMGGYIGASTTENSGETPIASVTYRIPAARWEDALDLLRGVAGPGTKVVAERTEAVEVTGQVIDLEARIRNLRASEAALQEIAASATRIADVLEVQSQLTAVRGQIEQLTAALGDLEDRAAYATLTATFRVPVVAVKVAQEGWDPAKVVDEASASLVSVLQALTSAGIWFAIVWLPILAGLGLIVLAVAWLVRRLGLVGPRGPKGGEVGAG